jgi:hypothetical protein
MAAISTQRLNELLQQVLEERTLANGWTTFEVPPDMRENRYPPEPSVADVLEGGIVPLWNPDRNDLGGWGTSRMATWAWRGSRPKRPHQGDPQPSYTHECYQCGRPITDDTHRWVDHAGRSKCDLALVDPADVATESYWTDHQPKPVHGEEVTE